MPHSIMKNIIIETKKPYAIVPMKSGYVLEQYESQEQDQLQIRSPEGKICLRIHLTQDGPQVELSAASLAIETKGNLSLQCDQLHLQTQQSFQIESGGDVSVSAEGDIKTEAFSQHLHARRGNINATANDDIDLFGERVLLNSQRSSNIAKKIE